MYEFFKHKVTIIPINSHSIVEWLFLMLYSNCFIDVEPPNLTIPKLVESSA